MKLLNKRQKYIKECIKDKKEIQIGDILEYIKSDFSVV